MNNYLKKMYSGTNVKRTETATKNPNRVAGGLRGQGHDKYSVLGEDGREHNIPSHQYVQSLEQKLKMLENDFRRLKKESKQQDILIRQLHEMVKRLR